MDNSTEVKKELDLIYREYKENKSQLNSEKTKRTAKLIIEMTFSDKFNTADVAAELARFSAEAVRVYFDSLTKSASIPINVIDELPWELYATDKDRKLSQHYVLKYAFAITSVMKYYKEDALKSSQLPALVAFIAGFAAKNNKNALKNKKKFQNLINNTDGSIYMLDYSGIEKTSLANIQNATSALYPDVSDTKYGFLITEWCKKYGYNQEEKSDNNTSVSNDNITDSSNTKRFVESKEDADFKFIPETKKAIKDTFSSSAASENNLSCETIAKKLYVSLKRDIEKRQEDIINAFTNMTAPIGKALDSIQGEINNSRNIAVENASLKAKNEDLERQISDIYSKLREANQSLLSTRNENDELKAQIASLKSENSELDSKLNDAYAINSRESSLEAEKIRSELKKSFEFLYEDWLEYEFSEVSEENYESLQAIIKKIFRSLDRNGINYKGTNR